MILVWTLGCWLLSFLKEPYAIVVFSLLFSWYFYERFHRLILIFAFLGMALLHLWFLPSFTWAESGIYEVYDIKTNYVLARNQKRQTIVLYGIENPQFYDSYSVKRIQKISGQNNIGVFNFAHFMAEKNIYCSAMCSDADLVKNVPCLKNRIFMFLKNQNNPSIMKVFYGHSIKELDWINRLGLPILGFLNLLQKWLAKYFDMDTSRMITFFAGLFYMSYFSISTGLLRWMCFTLAKMYCDTFRHWFPAGFLISYAMMPNNLNDFAFVFPTLLSLSYHLITQTRMRWLMNHFILFSCLLYYFHSVDWIMLLLFPLIRKVYSAAFFLVFFPGWNRWMQWLDSIPHMEWFYMPGLFFSIGMILSLYAMIKNQYKKSIGWMLCCMFLFFMEPSLNPCFSVYMIDIGQGDCTLIVEPFEKSAVMIDAGQNLHHDNMELFVEPFLKQLHIRSLDALIVTHDDFDHSGGVESLSQRIQIRKLITDRSDSVPVSYPFESLLQERTTTDENSQSIVSYFSYDGIDYLWTGDAGIDIEKQMLEKYDFQNVDVLKLGHHGSKTSSSFEFLDACRPKLALVSAGYKNHYGHPDSSVIARCHDLGIHVLQTKDVGMIQIHSWHHFAYFQCANGLFGILFLK